MNGRPKGALSDLVKAQLDVDKMEYQRLHQEITQRLQIRSTLLTVVLSVAGFGTVVLGPVLATLLSHNYLFALTALLGVTVGMCYFSLILCHEMISHGRFMALCANYMHNEVRRRIRRRLNEQAESDSNTGSGRGYGSLDWEAFLSIRAKWRQPKEGGWFRRWLATDRLTQLLQGEWIPALIAAASWIAALVLWFTHGEALLKCHYDDFATCDLTKKNSKPMYHGALILSDLLWVLWALALVLFGYVARAGYKMSGEFRDIISVPPSNAGLRPAATGLPSSWSRAR